MTTPTFAFVQLVGNIDYSDWHLKMATEWRPNEILSSPRCLEINSFQGQTMCVPLSIPVMVCKVSDLFTWNTCNFLYIIKDLI